MKNPGWAYKYAHNVIKGKWLGLILPIIMKEYIPI
jgi:hypothetical protein